MAAGRPDATRQPRYLSVAVACAVAVHVLTVVALRPASGGAGRAEPRAKVMVTRLIAVPVQDGDRAPLQPVNDPGAPGTSPPARTAATAPATPGEANRIAAVPAEAPRPAASMPASTVVAAMTPAAGSAFDQGPRPLAEIDPEVPPSAGQRGGSVTLQLVISERGDVERIAVVSATPPGLFEEAALAAFGRARYAPALRAGMPVRSDVTYQVDFAPLSTGADASTRVY